MSIRIIFGEKPVPEPVLHVSLSAVLVGGEPWQAHATWAAFREVQEWWFEQFNVALYLGRVLHYYLISDDRKDDFHTHVFDGQGLSYPCLSFDIRPRLDNGTDLGRDFGEFAIVAFSNDWWQEVAKHELGHQFGLRHNVLSFMHPAIEQSHQLPVLPHERMLVRDHAVVFAGGTT